MAHDGAAVGRVLAERVALRAVNVLEIQRFEVLQASQVRNFPDVGDLVLLDEDVLEVPALRQAFEGLDLACCDRELAQVAQTFQALYGLDFIAGEVQLLNLLRRLPSARSGTAGSQRPRTGGCGQGAFAEKAQARALMAPVSARNLPSFRFFGCSCEPTGAYTPNRARTRPTPP